MIYVVNVYGADDHVRAAEIIITHAYAKLHIKCPHIIFSIKCP